MSAFKLLAVPLTVLAVAACNPFHKSPAVEMSAKDTTLNSRWHGNLASPATLAGAVQMNGSASMAPDSDKSRTVTTVDLANATPGGLHPWAMHRGQCGATADKGVFGSKAAYSPLKVDSDGRASGTATIPIATPRTGDYFIVVYASAVNSEAVVACGNLASPTL